LIWGGHLHETRAGRSGAASPVPDTSLPFSETAEAANNSILAGLRVET